MVCVVGPDILCFIVLRCFSYSSGSFLTYLTLNLTCFFPSSVAFSELLFDDEIWTNVVNSLSLESERKMFLANISPLWPPVDFSYSSPFISADPAERRNSASTSIPSHRGLKHENSALREESEASSTPSPHDMIWDHWLAKTPFSCWPPGSFTAELFSKQIPSGHTTGLFSFLPCRNEGCEKPHSSLLASPGFRGLHCHLPSIYFSLERQEKMEEQNSCYFFQRKAFRKMQQPKPYSLCVGHTDSGNVFSASHERKIQKLDLCTLLHKSYLELRNPLLYSSNIRL